MADGSHTYDIAFQYEQDAFLLDFGTAGAYHRFMGAVSVRRSGPDHTETLRARTLWELLHFAPTTSADGSGLRSSPDHIPPVGHQA
ncbi:hypothetical protein OHT20_36785 [Streptomyces caniferus]|uniref:Uncharacterized protein n=1 Tax=Streptomyces caniferus TaxID=285557 RepID=A0A640S9G1_9ACTN|nr:hypothetical protein [Streptomyces caniferus]GFE07707.1 hypothetical protein Scani_39750 [Streptomyces caniferus]